METFEIHITGSSEICTALDQLEIKHIEVGLLASDLSLIRSQRMSSTVQQFKSLEDAIKWTEGLSNMLEAWGVTIDRKKIESPYQTHYINRCLYLEAHWLAPYFPTDMPMSRIKDKVVLTDRTYKRENFDNFVDLYRHYGIEMCLYDTHISEDFDWLDSSQLFDNV